MPGELSCAAPSHVTLALTAVTAAIGANAGFGHMLETTLFYVICRGGLANTAGQGITNTRLEAGDWAGNQVGEKTAYLLVRV
jgi:hypothetical protein